MFMQSQVQVHFVLVLEEKISANTISCHPSEANEKHRRMTMITTQKIT